MQTLYQWQLTDKDLSELVDGMTLNPSLSQDYAKADQDYFRECLRSIVNEPERLASKIDPLLDRPFVQLDPVERAVLYLGACELSDHHEVPYKVIINEAVELAKSYGAEQSHKFINGVLDKYADDARALEKSAQKSAHKRS